MSMKTGATPGSPAAAEPVAKPSQFRGGPVRLKWTWASTSPREKAPCRWHRSRPPRSRGRSSPMAAKRCRPRSRTSRVFRPSMVTTEARAAGGCRNHSWGEGPEFFGRGRISRGLALQKIHQHPECRGDIPPARPYSSGWWLQSRHGNRTKSIPTGITVAIITASCPAPAGGAPAAHRWRTSVASSSLPVRPAGRRARPAFALPPGSVASWSCRPVAIPEKAGQQPRREGPRARHRRDAGNQGLKRTSPGGSPLEAPGFRSSLADGGDQRGTFPGQRTPQPGCTRRLRPRHRGADPSASCPA